MSQTPEMRNLTRYTSKAQCIIWVNSTIHIGQSVRNLQIKQKMVHRLVVYNIWPNSVTRPDDNITQGDNSDVINANYKAAATEFDGHAAN